MFLGTFDPGDGPRTGLLLADHDAVVDLHAADPLLPRDMCSLLEAGPQAMDHVRAVADGNRVPDGALHPLNEVHLLAPVPKPGRYLDFYSFEEHVRTCRRRRGLDVVPEWYEHPTYYNGNPYGFVAPGADVTYPDGEDQRDYEMELAVVIGRRVRDLDPGSWQDVVAGFTILDDFSARRIQMATAKVGLGPAAGKDFATGLGPWIATPDEVPDVADLRLVTRVDDETWSDGLFGSAYYDWGAMLAWATRGQELRPGDVVGSGTFGGGCGYELDRFLLPGQTIEMEMRYEGRILMTLRHQVRA